MKDDLEFSEVFIGACMVASSCILSFSLAPPLWKIGERMGDVQQVQVVTPVSVDGHWITKEAMDKLIEKDDKERE